MNSGNGINVSRRTLLKQTAVASSALALGPRGTMANESAETIDIEVWFSKQLKKGPRRDALEELIEASAKEIEEQAAVTTKIKNFNSANGKYKKKKGNNEILKLFREKEKGIDTGQINILVVSHIGTGELTSLYHDGVFSQDSAPVVVFNSGFLLADAIAHGYFNIVRNLITTGVLRPIVGCHMQDAPLNKGGQKVNSFGTVYESADGNAASPLATWHTPKNSCELDKRIQRLDDYFSKADDTLDTCCGLDDVPSACSWSGKLSSCTKSVLEHHVRNDYLLNSHTITIRDKGMPKSEESYKLKVEGSLKQIQGQGDIKDKGTRSVATGWTTPEDIDKYEYTGRIVDFKYSDKKHNVYIDGERVEPWSLKHDTIEITHEGSAWKSYDIKATSTLRGSNLDCDDSFSSDRSASGVVSKGKTDVYTYYGGILDSSDFGEADTTFKNDRKAYSHGSASAPKEGCESLEADGSYYFAYSGDDNEGKESVVISRADLPGSNTLDDGPNTYEITVDYSLALQSHSGEADLRFYARTNQRGDNWGFPSDVRIQDWSRHGGDRYDSGSKTFTLTVDSNDDGIVLLGHLDNEWPGTSYIDAEVTAKLDR